MSFVIFFCGVAAIYMHHGTCRTVLLTVVFVLLLAIAAWQTIQKLKNR